MSKRKAADTHEEPSAESLAEIPEIDWSKAKVTRRVPSGRMPTHISLSEMRMTVSMTQAEVAAAMGTNEAEISRLEARSDNVLLSTLKRYAEAIGCRCEVSFVFPRGDRLFLQNENAARVIDDD